MFFFNFVTKLSRESSVPCKLEFSKSRVTFIWSFLTKVGQLFETLEFQSSHETLNKMAKSFFFSKRSTLKHTCHFTLVCNLRLGTFFRKNFNVRTQIEKILSCHKIQDLEGRRRVGWDIFLVSLIPYLMFIFNPKQTLLKPLFD